MKRVRLKMTHRLSALIFLQMDARVETVTESTRLLYSLVIVALTIVIKALNVLRMVKLFGWESNLEAKISATREAELKGIRRRELLKVLSTVFQ
jgi:hypothetical protein